MPEVVAHGRQAANPTIFACSLCHQTSGKGRPENASVAGLPYDYIVQQLTDFRNGLRKTSDPRKANTGTMAGFAKAMTDDEIKQAATFFASASSKNYPLDSTKTLLCEDCLPSGIAIL